MGNRRRKPPKVGDLIYILDINGTRIYGSVVGERGCQVKVWWFGVNRAPGWWDRTVISVAKRS
jgi:hypothetical protein